MSTDFDSFKCMIDEVLGFHKKHHFKEHGGEEMTYRIALMVEELGEISACVTKGKEKDELAEECADLFILLLGTAISQEIDLNSAFWKKMEKINNRHSKMINGRIRVSEFK